MPDLAKAVRYRLLVTFSDDPIYDDDGPIAFTTSQWEQELRRVIGMELGARIEEFELKVVD